MAKEGRTMGPMAWIILSLIAGVVVIVFVPGELRRDMVAFPIGVLCACGGGYLGRIMRRNGSLLSPLLAVAMTAVLILLCRLIPSSPTRTPPPPDGRRYV